MENFDKLKATVDKFGKTMILMSLTTTTADYVIRDWAQQQAIAEEKRIRERVIKELSGDRKV